MVPPTVHDGAHGDPGRGWTGWPQGWPAWRNRLRLAANVHFVRNPDVRAKEAPTDGVETGGVAEGCFTCQAHPGRVMAPVDGGFVWVVCPSCTARDTHQEEKAA